MQADTVGGTADRSPRVGDIVLYHIWQADPGFPFGGGPPTGMMLTSPAVVVAVHADGLELHVFAAGSMAGKIHGAIFASLIPAIKDRCWSWRPE